MNLNFEFSGATPPAGSAPWLTATFQDNADNGAIPVGTVRLTMSAANLVANEFASVWNFNLNPSLTPGLLTFTPVNIAAVASVGISTGVDAFKADGDGYFDISFDFPPPPGAFAGKFTSGESVVYDITYGGAGFGVNSFSFGSAPGGGNGTYLTAAHVQGIGSSAGGSGWIGPVNPPGAVPEATSFIIWSMLIVGAGMRASRRRP
jgi:hypothetical protein